MSDACNAYALAKSHRLPQVSKLVSATKPFDMVYMDIWGPIPGIGINGECYFLLIVYDNTKF